MAKFSGFRNSSLRNSYESEDIDPTSGLTNLADCMLVLACGLMVALVVAWNIDISSVTELSSTENLKEADNIEGMSDDLNVGGVSYIDMGRVYQDPETGKLYMIEENPDTDENASENGASSE